MTDPLAAWATVIHDAARSPDVPTLAGVVLAGVERVTGHRGAGWSRSAHGGWAPVGEQDAPSQPPTAGWVTTAATAGGRELVLGWPDVPADAPWIELARSVLEGSLRRLQAEAAARAATQSGSRRLATVLDASPDAVLVVDGHGLVVHANARAADLFGYPLDELVDGELDRLVPDDLRSRHADLRAGYLAHPTQRAMAAGQDLRARHRDGTEFPVDIALAPIEADGIPAVAAFVRDATARHDAEQHRRRLRDAEQAREQALELNDNVVQGLTASVWLMEMADLPEALAAARRTLESARGMMRDLLEHAPTALGPGALQRSAAVPTGNLGSVSVEQQPDTSRGRGTQTSPVRVVLADDSEDIRVLMDMRLRAVQGIELVALAADGIEAVEAVQAHAPDVILMDLSMPRLDGLEATTQITRDHPDVRVLVLTGHPRATVEPQALAAGAHDVVEKGGSFDDLVARVRAAVA